MPTASALQTAPAQPRPVDELGAREVLAELREAQAAEDSAGARKLLLAATWADLNPALGGGDGAAFHTAGFDQPEPVAGDGCPEVAELAVPELGACLGMSTTAAKRLIGHALELRHRLPRLWSLVHAGRLSGWRARAVAEATIHAFPRLTPEAARWVDGQAAAVAGKVGPAQLDRLVAEAIKRFELAAPEDHCLEDPNDGLWDERRYARIDTDNLGYTGTAHVEAEIDLADALDLEQALSDGARGLRDLGCTASLDARRAMALGDLARTQTALDLTRATDPGSTTPTRTARELVLHVHLTGATSGTTTGLSPTGHLEQGRHLVLTEQVKDWCRDSHTRVTVRPVLDLAEPRHSPGYAIPDRIREHVVQRDRTCTFPWCSRPARACDLDHVVPYDHDAETLGLPQPGPTSTDNLAALCRTHHRVKTHSAWRVRMETPGVLDWTSPHGHRFRRDATGTTAVGASPPER